MSNRVFMFLVFIVFLSACSSSTGTKSEEIYATEWKLLSVKAIAKDELLFPGTEIPTLKIEKDGRVSGFAGCNQYFGTAEIQGSSIKFDKIGATRKFCMEHLDIETAVLNILNEADDYSIEKGELVLKKGQKELARFSPVK